MEQPTHTEAIPAGFKEIYSNRFAIVQVNPDNATIICVLTADYVPIDFFKETFLEISKIAERGSFEKFVFDKRSLRTFHQPSMEWYFIHWKKDMLDYGIKLHRKILPEIDWFQKAVMIAKDELINRYPENVINELDIKYCLSIEEALRV